MERMQDDLRNACVRWEKSKEISIFRILHTGQQEVYPLAQCLSLPFQHRLFVLPRLSFRIGGQFLGKQDVSLEPRM